MLQHTRQYYKLIYACFLVLEAKVEYQILNGYVTGEPYDYGSVMHYGYFFFSLDRKIPTIVKLMPGGVQIGQRKGFSDVDLRKINTLYNCKDYVSKCTIIFAEQDILQLCRLFQGFRWWRSKEKYRKQRNKREVNIFHSRAPI